MSWSGFTWPQLIALALAAGLALAAWRRSPLPRIRRAAAILLRLASVAVVLLALGGVSVIRRIPQPRHLVYAVDQSASIDAARTRWQAERLASLESLRPPALARSLIVFGRQAHAIPLAQDQPMTDPQALAQALGAAGIDRGETDLEAALLGSLIDPAPSDSDGRGAAAAGARNVILITDARQTVGHVDRVLPHLRRFGVRVFPMAVPTGRSAGATWERLWVAPTAKQGASVPVKLLFSNGTGRPQPAEVIVRMQGVPVARARYRLPDAWHVVSMSVPAVKVGTMALEIDVRVGEAASPQRREAYVEVDGPPQVLFVTDQSNQLPALAAALREREIGLAVSRPGELPAEAGRLLDYDAIMLAGIPKSSITQPQADALRQYAEQFGGGVVMVGLGGRLDREIATPAPLDELLPVRFEPKGLQEAQRRVCVLLLIDRSASMLGPRIAATKRAAVELIKQLSPEDLVGVLAFDTAPYVVLEIQPAAQAAGAVVEKLVRLKSTGGTDLLPALKAAQARLLMTDAKVRHVILLSDGNTPFDDDVYRRLLMDLALQQVSISTIGIGSAFINTEILDLLARSTGGTFYQLNSLEELPRLIAQDTEQALGRLPFSEGYFRPMPGERAGWFDDVQQWPPLKGYLTATAKPGARVELDIPREASVRPGAAAPGSVPQPPGQLERDALLARWPVGLGQVVSFTSDADARWSPDWVRWPEYPRVWAQLLREVMRPRAEEELFVWMDERQGGQALMLEGRLAQPDAQLIDRAGRSAGPLALVQESRLRWSAQVGQLEPGWYRLAVSSEGDGREAEPAGVSPPDQDGQAPREPRAVLTRWVQIGRAESVHEDPGLPSDQTLLAHIGRETRGASEAPDMALVPAQEWSEQSVSLRPWLLPLAVLLLLADVALRGRTLL